MTAKLATVAPYVEIAHARLATWIGVDLRRGGLARSVERHVESTVLAKAPTVAEWSARLDSPMSADARALIEVATIPHSWLFRDEGQLAALEQTLGSRPRGPLRVLVAGCARGEDAYTIASIALRVGHDVRVLGIDVNESALADARVGRFGEFQSRDIPPRSRADFARGADGLVHASATLRSRVAFERRSLVDAIPEPRDGASWDVVVCRNVLIYFARQDAFGIVRRLGDRLVEGGLLVLGASDVLADLPAGLEPSATHGRALLQRRSSPNCSRVAHEAARGSGAFARPPIQVRSVAARRAPTTEVGTPMLDERDAIMAALDAGDLALARRFVDSLLITAPDAEAQLLAGLCAFAEERLDEAASRFRRVCMAAPGSWVAWMHLGLCSERLGRDAAALEAFARVPLATGEGEDLPRGSRELPSMLRAARSDLTRLAMRRIASESRRGAKP